MNRKAHGRDIEEIIKLIFALLILIPFLGVISSLFISQFRQCPQCEDCTPYKINASNLSQQLEMCKNQSQEIIYVNQTVEVPGETQIVYRDRHVGDVFIEVSLLIIVGLSLTLFKFRLPKKVEKEVEKYTKWIKAFKAVSLTLIVLIVIRLVWVFFSLF